MNKSGKRTGAQERVAMQQANAMMQQAELKKQQLDASYRANALNVAAGLHQTKIQNTGGLDNEAVLETAEAFYQFLKGDA